MKYGIEFQYLAKSSSRPSDDGEVVGITADDKTGTVILPNIGDHVNIDNSLDGGERTSFKGRVKSRFFSYHRLPADMFCMVNIVVEEVDQSVFATLIKE